MYSAILVFTLLEVLMGSIDDLHSYPVHHHKEFESFLLKHSRKYSTEAEKTERFKLFSKNLMEIAEHNAKHPHTVFGVTQFTDRTDDELRKMTMHNMPETLKGTPHWTKDNFCEHDDNDVDADEVDWRKKGKVTAVKNQGSCGSCWTFAAIAAVESGLMIRYNSSVDLSEQAVLDCETTSYGCDGGFVSSALELTKDVGVFLENDIPYRGARSNCYLPSQPYIRTKGYVMLDKYEDAIKKHIASHGPVSASFTVSKEFFNYHSGVYSVCSPNSYGGHAIAIVGFGTDSNSGMKYWIIKNSWGTSWGDGGFVKYERGRNLCAIEERAMGVEM